MTTYTTGNQTPLILCQSLNRIFSLSVGSCQGGVFGVVVGVIEKI